MSKIKLLFIAIENKDIEEILKLIPKISFNDFTTEKDKFGRTIIHNVITGLGDNIKDLKRVVDRLIDKNPDTLGVKSIINQNILQYVINHQVPIRQFIFNLIKNKLSIQGIEETLFNRDAYGNTFLHLAAKDNQAEFIKYCFSGLKSVESDFIVKLISITNNKNETAIAIAKKSGHTDISNFLSNIKALYISNDDSSDEEDSVEGYDIEKRLEDFKEENSCYFVDNFMNLIDTSLSFITHAAGINLLYNSKVQKRYYEIKREKLIAKKSINELLKTDQNIKQDLESMVEKEEYFTGKEGKKETLYLFRKLVLDGIYTRIITDKVNYSRKYVLNAEEVTDNYFHSIFKSNNLNIEDIKRFDNNFSIPFPFRDLPSQTLENTNFDLSRVSEEKFVIEFLAHLRLHNRSEKRHIKNSEKCKNTSWQIISHDKQIKLHNESVNNINRYRARNEQVEFSGDHWASYTDIFLNQSEKEIQTLLKNRINIKAENNTLSDKILVLWYLLFGCEVIKNPASLIHHNMVLDLVGAGKLEWHDKMVENIPMSQNKILSKVMALNSVYGDFMPHNYYYNRETADIPLAVVLIKREADITKQWLELKLGKSVASYMINQCVTDNNAVKTIWSLIFESSQNWGFHELLFNAVEDVEKLTMQLDLSTIANDTLYKLIDENNMKDLIKAINSGADIEQLNDKGQTPLIHAIITNRPEMISISY